MIHILVLNSLGSTKFIEQIVLFYLLIGRKEVLIQILHFMNRQHKEGLTLFLPFRLTTTLITYSNVKYSFCNQLALLFHLSLAISFMNSSTVKFFTHLAKTDL